VEIAKIKLLVVVKKEQLQMENKYALDV